MDIFKLFFNHDQRLDKLAKRNANKTREEVEASLQDFMSPTPTFSKFYITGTRLEEEKFGLNRLAKYNQIEIKLDEIFRSQQVQTSSGTFRMLSETVKDTPIGHAIVISDRGIDSDEINKLAIDYESNVGHRKDELRNILIEGHTVIYKEQAHDGYDLHLFSKDNIYPLIFEPMKTLVDVSFRYFSINSKRMGSERHFYFETWTLDHPPHGAEEVLPDTVL